ncbi:hypothetical protein QO200_07265 [Flavobacterium sp. Arc3]|jgi:hypothetical protein|uniref:hypothetical protein n=1 Tax=unclassified Flavobacterium TaxID=196869 RepID=UPI00352EF11D
MNKAKVTIIKMETISVLAAIVSWFISMLLFALIFNVSNHLFLYLSFLVLNFVSFYGAFKYFTGTFEIIFNEEENTATVRWEKKVILSNIKEQTIDLNLANKHKVWSGRANDRVKLYLNDGSTVTWDISSFLNARKNGIAQDTLIELLKKYTAKT